jgi:hypothetical protein
VIANILHDWTDAECTAILKTIHAAMQPSARIWIVEHVLDAPGKSFANSRDIHLVDLHMLVMFGARERTAAEYDALLESAGFSRGTLHTTESQWDVIESKR